MSTPPSSGQGPAEPDPNRGEQSQQGSPRPDHPNQGEHSQQASPDHPATSPQPDHPRQGYQHPDYPQQSYPPQGYPQQGYPAPGYAGQDYPQQGYPPPEYPRQGYSQQDYPPPGYPPAYGNYPGGGGFAAPPDDPLVPANFSGWFDRIIVVFRRSFSQLALLQLLVAAVSAVFGIVTAILTPDIAGLSAALESGNPLTPEDLANARSASAAVGTIGLVGLLGTLATVIVSAFVQAASVFVAIRDAAGQPTSAAEGLRLSTRRAFPLLGWEILAGIMIGIGLLLLIIPGVYLLVVFGATLLGVVVVERAGIGRCFTLVHRRFWPTVGRILLFVVIGGIYLLVTQALGSLIGGGPTSVVTPVVQAILYIPLGVAITAVAVVSYAELRFHEQGTTTAPALVAEMSR